jgi:hypothetical protein
VPKRDAIMLARNISEGICQRPLRAVATQPRGTDWEASPALTLGRKTGKTVIARSRRQWATSRASANPPLRDESSDSENPKDFGVVRRLSHDDMPFCSITEVDTQVAEGSTGIVAAQLIGAAH